MSGGCCSKGKCLGSSGQGNAPGTQQQAPTPSIQSEDSSSITIEKMECCGFGDMDSNSKGEPNSEHNIQPVAHSLPDTRRIILTVENLKCGCCGDGGISRALGQIPGVYNYHVNVVLARAEFDLDTRRTSIGEVTKRLATVTGYTFKQYFQPHGQVLEVLVDDPAELCLACTPYGVSSIELSEKSSWAPRILSGRNSAVPLFSRTSTPSPWPLPMHKSPNIAETEMTPKKKSRAKLLHAQSSVEIHYNARLIGARDVVQYYERLLGKKIHLAPLASHPSLAAGTKQTVRACCAFLLSAAFTVPVLFFAWGPVDHERLLYAHLSLAFATVVQAIGVWEFFPGACRTMIHAHTFDMDSLIAISTSVAYIFSVISYAREVEGKPLETGSFFETSTLLVTLILLGRVFSEFSRSRAAKSVSFRSLQVDEAHLVIASESFNEPQTLLIDARLLQYGDRFKVFPETRIVTDGIVKHGGSEVDESMITGEALPVAKGIGSSVHAGTNNGSGTLFVEVTQLPHENSVSKIATLVENAELTKPKAQAIADRVAAWFVPTIIMIALSVFVIWILVERYKNHRDSSSAAITAFTYAIATFVVSCPCAIGLAVPMVVLIASGVAARAGIIFRDPQKMETARGVTDVIFDKTGTLTTGDLTVMKEEYVNGSEKEVKQLLQGLLSGMKHPASVAVYKHIRAQHPDLQPADLKSVKSIPGSGIQGTTPASVLISAGSPSWLAITLSPTLLSTSQARSSTHLCVTISSTHRATFLLSSTLRPSAAPTIQRLQTRGLRVHLLTGDHSAAALSVARSLDIPPSLTHSRLKPDQKKAYIEALTADGKTPLFVGDGTNDAAALKAAAVGVHLNAGSDIAKSAADVVLMNADLRDVLVLLDVSRAAYRRIVANFAWSFVYNCGAVVAASGALRVWRVEPRWAGLGEVVSVVPVLVVAWSMRWGVGGRYRGVEGV